MNGTLNRYEIHDMIARGQIIGADLANVNAASLNVRLGPEFMLEASEPWSKGQLMRPRTICNFSERHLPGKLPKMISIAGSVILTPHTFCLASIVERLVLPLNIAAHVMLRSSAARMGIDHSLAGFCDPGYDGHLTLELHSRLHNHGIRLQEGDSICQIVFERIRPVRDGDGYAGKYNGDKGPTQAKPEVMK